MKISLQAQSQLPAPQGLPAWLSKLPAANPAGPRSRKFQPIGGLVLPAESSRNSVMAGYPHGGRFGAQLLLTLCTLLFKRSPGKASS